MIDIQIATILSNRTKEGMIEFIINDGQYEIKTQWDIAKAREIRDMLQGAIEAAITDQMIWEWLTKKVNISDEKAAQLLLDFRFIRQGSKGAVYPS